MAVPLAGLAVLLAGCGGKSTSKEVVVAHASAAGARAAAEASTTLSVAEGLKIRVTAEPKQHVTGSWSIFCRVGSTASARDADDFRGAAPLTVPMRDVGVTAGAESCSVVADAKLARSGRLKVQIVGPVP